MAQEIAMAKNPEEYVLTFQKNQTMVKISIILSGEEDGISNTGETFSEDGLDFSTGRTVDGLEVSQSYVNYMGTWAYSMKCPVIKDGKDIASLYVEYIYDSLDESLPNGFYDKKLCSILWMRGQKDWF